MTDEPAIALPELYDWHQTGNAFFPVAAKVGRSWCVMRLNSFPDHPLWTFFVDGQRRADLDDVPQNWANPADPGHPLLLPDEAADVLGPVADFIAYGSEIGQPCENPDCCG